MDARDARIQTLFRALNERTAGSKECREAPAEERHRFLCECGEEQCREPVYLSLAEYETVRASPTRFAVRPGHELPEVERVVGRLDGCVIVEKFGRLRYIAEQSHPRVPGVGP
jgi:hypothetical protein